MQQESMPVWLSTYNFTLENGTPVSQTDTGYAFHLFPTWKKKPVIEKYAGLEDHVYRGENSTDWLIVTLMKTAVPGHNMALWVNGILQMIGFPDNRMAQAFPTAPLLVTWAKQPPCAAFLKKSGCDEMMTFTGSAIAGHDHARLFMMILRKDNLGWKFFFSAKSNWGSGGNEVAELYNDHLNASQIFGSLRISKIG